MAALAMIGERGVGGLAIDPLARELGVTKGSFYWHFENLEALLEAALARWERVFTDLKYGALEKISDPSARMRALLGDVLAEDPAIRVLIALLEAHDDPAVRSVVRRATEKRLRFMERSLAGPGVSSSGARDHALLLYSVYVGFVLLRDLSLPGLSRRAQRAATAQRLFDRIMKG